MNKQKNILEVHITRTRTGTKFFFRSDVFEKFFADVHAKDFDKNDLIENATAPFNSVKLYRTRASRVAYPDDICTIFTAWTEEFPFKTYDPTRVNLTALRAVGLAQGVTLEVPGLFMTDCAVKEYLRFATFAAQEIYLNNIANQKQKGA